MAVYAFKTYASAHHGNLVWTPPLVDIVHIRYEIILQIFYTLNAYLCVFSWASLVQCNNLLFLHTVTFISYKTLDLWHYEWLSSGLWTLLIIYRWISCVIICDIISREQWMTWQQKNCFGNTAATPLQHSFLNSSLWPAVQLVQFSRNIACLVKRTVPPAS